MTAPNLRIGFSAPARLLPTPRARQRRGSADESCYFAVCSDKFATDDAAHRGVAIIHFVPPDRARYLPCRRAMRPFISHLPLRPAQQASSCPPLQREDFTPQARLTPSLWYGSSELPQTVLLADLSANSARRANSTEFARVPARAICCITALSAAVAPAGEPDAGRVSIRKPAHAPSA